MSDNLKRYVFDWEKNAVRLSQCPNQLIWSLIARKSCNETHQFSCLYDLNTGDYKLQCQLPSQKRAGIYAVIAGNDHGLGCPCGYFQPFTFRSEQMFECVYMKSVCSGEGLVLAAYGTALEDVKCLCDFTRGFSYINPPRNKHGCVPSEEDCSCYLKPCPVFKFLSKDYTCTSSAREIFPPGSVNLSNLSESPQITTSNKNYTCTSSAREISPPGSVNVSDLSNISTSNRNAVLFLGLACSMGFGCIIMVFVILFRVGTK